MNRFGSLKRSGSVRSMRAAVESLVQTHQRLSAVSLARSELAAWVAKRRDIRQRAERAAAAPEWRRTASGPVLVVPYVESDEATTETDATPAAR